MLSCIGGSTVNINVGGNNNVFTDLVVNAAGSASSANVNIAGGLSALTTITVNSYD